MTKEEIKEYLKRVEELELKLTGEDKDTLQWLIYGYNECARLLNQLETNINEAIEYINNCLIGYEEQYLIDTFNYSNVCCDLENISEILKGSDK